MPLGYPTAMVQSSHKSYMPHRLLPREIPRLLRSKWEDSSAGMSASFALFFPDTAFLTASLAAAMTLLPAAFIPFQTSPKKLSCRRRASLLAFLSFFPNNLNTVPDKETHDVLARGVLPEESFSFGSIHKRVIQILFRIVPFHRNRVRDGRQHRHHDECPSHRLHFHGNEKKDKNKRKKRDGVSTAEKKQIVCPH